MFDFDDLAAEDDEPPQPRSVLRALWWFNLSRRDDRRQKHEAALKVANLWDIAERVDAVDGTNLDLDALDPSVISPKAVHEAKNPPVRVVGVHMTRGAIGLWLSWHRALCRILEEDGDVNDCYLIAEDDAVYCKEFEAELRAVFEELDEYDPQWDAVQVGYFADECSVQTINYGTSHGTCELKRVVLPTWACGTAGIVVHGVRGARRLLEKLFPARPSQQLDTAFSYTYKKLRMYLSKSPLMVAEKSSEIDTDIQIMAEAVRGWNVDVKETLE